MRIIQLPLSAYSHHLPAVVFCMLLVFAQSFPPVFRVVTSVNIPEHRGVTLCGGAINQIYTKASVGKDLVILCKSCKTSTKLCERRSEVGMRTNVPREALRTRCACSSAETLRRKTTLSEGRVSVFNDTGNTGAPRFLFSPALQQHYTYAFCSY